MVTIEQAKELITFCKENGIKHIAYHQFAAEFFPVESRPMSLTPQDLAKVLTDSMPPDSSMLFASTEDISEEKIE